MLAGEAGQIKEIATIGILKIAGRHPTILTAAKLGTEEVVIHLQERILRIQIANLSRRFTRKNAEVGVEETVTVDSSEIVIKNISNENPYHRWYLVKPVVQAQDITDNNSNNNVEIQPLHEITEEVIVHTATLSAQLIVEGVAVVVTLLRVVEEILVVAAEVIVAMTIIIVTLQTADIMRIIIVIMVHLNEVVVDQENLYPLKLRCHPDSNGRDTGSKTRTLAIGGQRTMTDLVYDLKLEIMKSTTIVLLIVGEVRTTLTKPLDLKSMIGAWK